MKPSLVLSTIVWIISFAVVHWIIDGSVWLTLLLASSFANGVYLGAEVRANRALFDIADAELVRVSALVERLTDELDRLQTQVEQEARSSGA